jgi:hypothetical protein
VEISLLIDKNAEILIIRWYNVLKIIAGSAGRFGYSSWGKHCYIGYSNSY